MRDCLATAQAYKAKMIDVSRVTARTFWARMPVAVRSVIVEPGWEHEAGLSARYQRQLADIPIGGRRSR